MPSADFTPSTKSGRMRAKQVAAVALLALVSATLRSQTADPRPLPRAVPKSTAYPAAFARPPATAASSREGGESSAQSPTRTFTPTQPLQSSRKPGYPPENFQGGSSAILPEVVLPLTPLVLYLIIKAAEDRSHNGPSINPQLDMNDFTVEGLAGANWPVGFDFTVGSPGSVRIEVTSDGGHNAAIERRVAPGQRESFRFFLPPDFNAKVQDAKYHVLFQADTGATSATPGLRAFDLAAGECAVVMDSRYAADFPCRTLTSYRIPMNTQTPARPSLVWAAWTNERSGWMEPDNGSSVQLDQVSFGPGTIHPQLKEVANYSFRARHAFNDVRPDFMLTTSTNGHILLQKDREDQPFAVSEGEVAQKIWDAAKSKQGNHMLQLKAWRGLEAGGDWAIVWSQDLVTIEK